MLEHASRLSCLLVVVVPILFRSFFFNDTPPTEIYTLSLHDALPIFFDDDAGAARAPRLAELIHDHPARAVRDRKSTRLNSSHSSISYAVFCLKKKNRPEAVHGDVEKNSQQEASHRRDPNRKNAIFVSNGGHGPQDGHRRIRQLNAFFSNALGAYGHLHSFPTRRSSD